MLERSDTISLASVLRVNCSLSCHAKQFLCLIIMTSTQARLFPTVCITDLEQSNLTIHTGTCLQLFANWRPLAHCKLLQLISQQKIIL